MMLDGEEGEKGEEEEQDEFSTFSLLFGKDSQAKSLIRNLITTIHKLSEDFSHLVVGKTGKKKRKRQKKGEKKKMKKKGVVLDGEVEREKFVFLWNWMSEESDVLEKMDHLFDFFGLHPEMGWSVKCDNSLSPLPFFPFQGNHSLLFSHQKQQKFVFLWNWMSEESDILAKMDHFFDFFGLYPEMGWSVRCDYTFSPLPFFPFRGGHGLLFSHQKQRMLKIYDVHALGGEDSGACMYFEITDKGSIVNFPDGFPSMVADVLTLHNKPTPSSPSPDSPKTSAYQPTKKQSKKVQSPRNNKNNRPMRHYVPIAANRRVMRETNNRGEPVPPDDLITNIINSQPHYAPTEQQSHHYAPTTANFISTPTTSTINTSNNEPQSAPPGKSRHYAPTSANKLISPTSTSNNTFNNSAPPGQSRHYAPTSANIFSTPPSAINNTSNQPTVAYTPHPPQQSIAYTPHPPQPSVVYSPTPPQPHHYAPVSSQQVNYAPMQSSQYAPIQSQQAHYAPTEFQSQQYPQPPQRQYAPIQEQGYGYEE
eukprot:CAMPEP_0201540224 /NCGR_PEP_ID=MMETSP0161_2-20130828/70829_1 /ASSEMBLY_ACC=CAM_ASM_000251 /TAXON_ID=180227 /ORGANISM="Neoparamoeba aestuarina, Strain SoJaBio B1-5/56/2" /LENGTH=533 /DNA_ID=CAMNT_0047947675 /DNA_START=506 /DNA_END=2107 /DNA_ORIENTATION=-